MNIFTKKNVFLWLSMIFILFFISILTHHFCSKTESIVHSGIYYNSFSGDRNIASVKEFFEKRRIQPEKISISFTMKPEDLLYDNVFQTASDGKGIRMELYAPPAEKEANLDLFVGTIPGLPKVEQRYTLLTDAKRGATYSVDIKIDKNKKLKVWINNRLVLDITNKNLRYIVGDIAVGAGANKKRGFNGEIKDFNIEYKIVKRSRWFFVINILLFASFIYLVCGPIFKSLNSIMKSLRKFMKTTIPYNFFLRFIKRIIEGYSFLAAKENIILLHFFVCSIGLTTILNIVSCEIYNNYFTIHPKLSLWATQFFFPGKVEELLLYMFSLVSFFLYYACAFIILFKTRKDFGNDFFVFITKKLFRFIAYLSAAIAGNIFIISETIFFRLPAFLPAFFLWLCIFLFPFYYGYLFLRKGTIDSLSGKTIKKR